MTMLKKLLPIFIIILLVGGGFLAGSFSCKSLPKTFLGQCLQIGVDNSWFGSKSKDTGYIRECNRYHRKLIVDEYCSPATKKDNKKIKKKSKLDEICSSTRNKLKYIETGAY